MQRNVSVDTLVNASGLALHAIDYGGIITSLTTPDRDGALADIVLGHDRLDGYRPNPACLGAIIGRVANRRLMEPAAQHHVSRRVFYSYRRV